jgi:hypothetical protein
MTNLPSIVPISEMQIMAKAIASSGMFGFKKPEEALSLMLIAQAEGQHPALAARDYHVIQGKPTLKADAMLARFQAAGGRVEWKELNDNRVCAVFSHPQGGSVEIDWDMKRARAAELGGKGMWTKYPRQMLRARVLSEGIRTVYPGVVVGTYTPEEAEDFNDKPRDMGHVVDVSPHDGPIELADPERQRAFEWLSAMKQSLKDVEDFNALDNLVIQNMQEFSEGAFTAKTVNLGDEQVTWLNDILEKTRTRLYKAVAKETKEELQSYQPSTLMAG